MDVSVFADEFFQYKMFCDGVYLGSFNGDYGFYDRLLRGNGA